MLQQTTVKTVENKILEIINIFPSFNSFKNKRLEHLLKVWSGIRLLQEGREFIQSSNNY